MPIATQNVPIPLGILTFEIIQVPTVSLDSTHQQIADYLINRLPISAIFSKTFKKFCNRACLFLLLAEWVSNITKMCKYVNIEPSNTQVLASHMGVIHWFSLQLSFSPQCLYFSCNFIIKGEIRIAITLQGCNIWDPVFLHIVFCPHIHFPDDLR